MIRGCVRATLAAALLIVLSGCEPSGVPQLSEQAVAENNRGVGLMGYFDYEGARRVFAGLAEQYPDWHAVQVNLAIATLNRQQAGDEQTALAIVERVLAKDSGHLRASYVAGLLKLNAGACDEALEYFGRVAAADPADAYAAYYSALCRAQTGDPDAALTGYQQALHLDPYLRSAYYGAFQALQRLKKRDAAREMLAQFQRLADNPQARLAEFKYTRMGEKGEAQVVNLQEPVPPPALEGPLFAEVETLATLPPLSDTRYSGVSVADVDGDGALDLLLPRTPTGSLLATGRSQKKTGPGPRPRFTPAPDHPLSAISEVRSALWGDIDNDGLVDVYLLRNGPNQLWRQSPAGQWSEIAAAAAVQGGESDSVDGLILDADHDGDLDLLVVNAEGPIELFNNNLDGTFRPLAADYGLARKGRRVLDAQAVDIDRDRDLDLIVIYAEPPHDVFINDRLWSYRAANEMHAFRDQSLAGLTIADADADGQPELYGLASDGALLKFAPDEADNWHKTILAPAATAAAGPGAQLAAADLDGDGGPDLVYSLAGGWQAARIAGNSLQPMHSARAAALGHWLLVNNELPGGPALLGAVDDGAALLWTPGPGRHPFLGLSLTGLEETADSMRSNASGIGTRVALRVDSRWSVASTLQQAGASGQSLQPLFVGLGGYPRADYLALTWSDGVFQTELGVAAGELHRITETQRQLSSCPVLFAWDGQQFSFVSDLLGVGGIGFNTGFGQYAQPRPWEYFLLPEGSLVERDGLLTLMIAEPMEEVAYLDAARLFAYELPAGWDMFLDERMGLADPLPTGRPVFYRTERLPTSAVNERGEAVLGTLDHTDGVAAPVGLRDRRFIGRLAGEHQLELGFDQPLGDARGAPWLVIDGWVEYPYSQTGFAAWQAGADFRAPSLEAATENGEWQMLAEGFGYPAGMPRRMALPLTNLPAGTTRLRLTTNLEVYWDRIAVAYAESPPAALVVAELPLNRAEMSAPGFPLRINGPQRRPDYDYARRTPLWDTRHPQGFYSAFGEVTELLARHDDALAIVGPGEGLSLTFSAQALPSPRARLVLEARGWAKDMDLFTASGGQVGPLPVSGAGDARSEALHRRYNTRPEAGY